MMIHRYALALFIGWGSCSAVYAEDKALHDYGLMLEDNLPHLMKTIMKHKSDLDLTFEQKRSLKKLRDSVPPKMHEGLSKAKALEEQIADQVMHQGRSSQQLTQDLNQLKEIKFKNTILLIDALNQIQAILTPAQYQNLLEKLD